MARQRIFTFSVRGYEVNLSYYFQVQTKTVYNWKRLEQELHRRLDELIMPDFHLSPHPQNEEVCEVTFITAGRYTPAEAIEHFLIELTALEAEIRHAKVQAHLLAIATPEAEGDGK